jgi:hypothetical protein
MWSAILTSAAFAAPLQLAFKPFQIGAASNVYITGINDQGVAVGTYWSTDFGLRQGFVGRSGRVTTLPNPLKKNGLSALPMPTSINDQGIVAGEFLLDKFYGFVWASGSYVAQYDLGYQVALLPPPTLGAGRVIGYNRYADSGISSIYMGKINSPQAADVGGFGILSSLNSHNEAAGQFQWFIGSNPITAVFLYKSGEAQPLLPSGAISSFDGYINEVGQVAGAFVDSKRQEKGFLYTQGRFEIFSIPSESAKLTVDGVDSSGSVVGEYEDRVAKHGFVYRSGDVVTFGSWSRSDNVAVSISPLGLWIAVTIQSDTLGESTAIVSRCNC